MMFCRNHTSKVIASRERNEQIKSTLGGKQTTGPSCKTRLVRATKAKGMDKLSEVIKIKSEEERKFG